MKKKVCVWKLRLLAGKFEKICTTFPLTTLLRKILRRCPLEVFVAEIAVDLKFRQKLPHHLVKKQINLIFLIYDYFKFLTAKQLSTNFAIVLVQGYALSSSRNEKDEMTNGSHKRQNKIKFWNGFLNLAKRPWNTVSTKRVELCPIEFDLQLFVACHFIYFSVRWYTDATFRISCTGARTLINQNPIFVPRRIAQLRWFSK